LATSAWISVTPRRQTAALGWKRLLSFLQWLAAERI